MLTIHFASGCRENDTSARPLFALDYFVTIDPRILRRPLRDARIIERIRLLGMASVRNMNASFTKKTARRFLIASPWVVLMAVFVCSAEGCSDIDWNWGWWKQPRRLVRPSARRPDQPPPGESVTDQSPSSEGPADAAHLGRAESPEAMASGRGRGGQPSPAQFGAGQVRAFYHVYLTSGETKPVDDPEQRLKLNHADARTCARILEMLYVPVGRSGSGTESYLLYENRDEFQAAQSLAPALDVPALREAPSTVGPEAAFRAGVGLLLHILDSGAVVSTGLIEACERRLSEAAQSERLPTVLRWAAAILAGRVASEYRYDYATARSYYQQAQRLAGNDAIGIRTARWWTADTFAQEGQRRESAAIYEEILESTDIIDSQIIRRSRAILSQHKNR